MTRAFGGLRALSASPDGRQAAVENRIAARKPQARTGAGIRRNDVREALMIGTLLEKSGGAGKP
jgi:hypothetical protein